MNYIDLDGKRDFPFTTNVLKFMQDATAIIEKIAALGGTDYILTGCVNVGGDVISDGFVVLNGKVMPFVGGTEQNYIKVVTTTTTITVAEGSRDEISYHATFGASATDQYLWSEVSANRFDALTEVSDRLTALEASYNARLLEKVVNIGVWNMDVDSVKEVDLGLADYTKIRSISVMIFNDAGTVIKELTNALGTLPAGYWSYSSVTGFSLLRTLDGFFDNADYSTALNRGYIFVRYLA